MRAPSEGSLDDAALRRTLRRWQWAGAAFFLLLAAAFPVYRAVEDVRREDALAAREAALVTEGHGLWVQSCSSCHGTRGQGIDAPALNSQEFLRTVTDDQMHLLTAAGIPGTEMPAWWNEIGGPFTDEQIRSVVAYIRSWEATAPSRPDWRTPKPDTDD